MIRQYSHHEIKKWADYSGDRNRVHFDKEIAIKNGFQDVIVQGMLILLDAKMMMSSYIKTNSSLNFFIKKSVPVNTDVEYDIKEVNNKIFLTVSELDNPGETCVTATILPQNPPILKDKTNAITVSYEFIQTHLNLLEYYYPSYVKDNWLLMDTLLFCICFNQQKDDYFYRQSLKIAKNNSYDSITTYHVAQKLFVSERLLTCDNINFPGISYLVEEKDVYIQNDSAYSTFNIHAIEDDIIIFQSSIGCITKVADN